MAIPVPQGFRFAAVHCGIKQKSTKEDLTLIVADRPAVAAGVYTQNVVYAAPVAVDRQRTPSDNIRVIAVNSGNANACTGDRGLRDAREMARLAAEACGATADQALVMSTGVIGEYLPMDKVTAGIQGGAANLAVGEDAFLAAARGIMTTDKSHKVAGGSLDLGGETVHLAGLAKGAGMIGPRMATMLAVILTDAVLTPVDAQAALTDAVEDSFNCISVEGHMSTNDTALLLASGLVGPRPLEGDALSLFRDELRRVCTDLAVQIPDDGEGSTHLIRIDVRGTETRNDAFRIAKTVAESALVKTAIAGGDPNWGRIVSAVGYSGVCFDPLQLCLTLNGTDLYRDGAPLAFDPALVSKSICENRETSILLTVGQGEGTVRFWTSDLTVDYVTFNADYHT